MRWCWKMDFFYYFYFSLCMISAPRYTHLLSFVLMTFNGAEIVAVVPFPFMISFEKSQVLPIFSIRISPPVLFAWQNQIEEYGVF